MASHRTIYSIMFAFLGLASTAALQVAHGTARLASVRRGAASMQVATKQTEVQSLLAKNSALLKQLAAIGPDVPEMTRLRFAMAFPDAEEAKANLRELVVWRAGAGRSMVESAAKAVAQATANGGWDNEPVRLAAPHAAVVNKFITPKNILTLSTAAGDLVYVIRASAIDDKEMMSKVSVEQLTDFLLYVKEVHSLVVNARSERTGRFCQVMFANDITGTRKAPDPLFAKALTASSKSYEKLYPSLAGPTMILNLPFILQAFVGLFKPLFPKTVQARLKFDSAPFLAKLEDLSRLTTDPKVRSGFLREVDGLLGPMGVVTPTR